MDEMQQTSAIETRSEGHKASNVGAWILGVAVTLLAVFFILNYQRHISIDFLFFNVTTRLVWALLIPAALGIVIGFMLGRGSRRG